MEILDHTGWRRRRNQAQQDWSAEVDKTGRSARGNQFQRQLAPA